MSDEFFGELYRSRPANWRIGVINSSACIVRVMLSRFCPIKREKFFQRITVTCGSAEKLPSRMAKLVWREAEYSYQKKLEELCKTRD